MLCLPQKQGLLSPSHLPAILSPHRHHDRRPLITFDSLSSLTKCKERRQSLLARGYRSITIREDEKEEEDEEDWDRNSVSDRSLRFEEAVKLFNKGEYYACHDVLESLWYDSNDPIRTLLHALLQCAVGFLHLFNQNHKGAMMELGEGVCKLRKMNFDGGPFNQFEQEISAVLNFIYQTQLELASCNEDFCEAMEQSERSYQLLEGYGAGQRLYFLEKMKENFDETYILFDPQISYGDNGIPPTRVKLPTLQATSNHLMACDS